MENIEYISFDNENLDNLLITREKNQMVTEIEGEVVLLDLATDAFIGLDAIGSSIWNLLEPSVTFSALCQTLMEKYDVPEDVCKADVLSFLKELADNNLITVEAKSIR